MNTQRPSYDELASLVAQQAVQIKLQAALIVVLEARIVELERQLSANSRNSSRPPSTDSPFLTPAPKSLRKKSGLNPGGQPGHTGHTLTRVDLPDEVIRHEPASCGGCGSPLHDAADARVETRQVFDIPPVTVRVTEHRLVSKQCACGVVTAPAAPAGVTAPVQYGPRVQAVCVYLYSGQFLSQSRTAQALTELCGVPMSEGTVAAITARAGAGLAGFVDVVKQRIIHSPVAGFDETGLRVEGRLSWVHVARTNSFTLYTHHAKRGREGMDDAGVLPNFAGVMVRDAWAPYDRYSLSSQLCSAHVLRELQAVTDTTPDGEWCWAEQAATALVALQTARAAAIITGADSMDEAERVRQIGYYRSAATLGMEATSQRRDTAEKKHHALARRLYLRESEYLRFVTDFRVPPDNNGSERDIRMVKLRQKISGTLRSTAGADAFLAIRSYLSTAQKHGKGVLDVLLDLTHGRPWIPA